MSLKKGDYYYMRNAIGDLVALRRVQQIEDNGYAVVSGVEVSRKDGTVTEIGRFGVLIRNEHAYVPSKEHLAALGIREEGANDESN